MTPASYRKRSGPWVFWTVKLQKWSARSEQSCTAVANRRDARTITTFERNGALTAVRLHSTSCELPHFQAPASRGSMRLLVSLCCVVAIAIAAMMPHVGNAAAMDMTTDAVMMAEMKMEMGTATPADCPPAKCATMKDCTPASSPLAATFMSTTAASIVYKPGQLQFAFDASAQPDSLSGSGLRRPPRFI